MKYCTMLWLCLSAFIVNGQTSSEELGLVNWQRDFDKGLQQAATENKPVFLFFQEVPGCATCRNYGHHVMSHPLIVEAIETFFVPVAIFNNKKGKDAEVLEMYSEPSWNNPVVRIVRSNKENVTRRLAGDYSQLGVVKQIITAMKQYEMKVPAYLTNLREELQAEKNGTATAVLGMYCFWSGEKNIGAIKGVLNTTAGFMGGKEVVKVEYNPSVLSFSSLLAMAKKTNNADFVFTAEHNERLVVEKVIGKNKCMSSSAFKVDREPRYYLSKTVYQYLPMTPMQATKANSMIAKQQSPDALLSPVQKNLLKKFKKDPRSKLKSVINQDIIKAWATVVHLI